MGMQLHFSMDKLKSIKQDTLIRIMAVTIAGLLSLLFILLITRKKTSPAQPPAPKSDPESPPTDEEPKEEGDGTTPTKGGIFSFFSTFVERIRRMFVETNKVSE